MPDTTIVTEHYSQGALIAAIRSALERQGLTPDSVGIDDLAPVDEFHTGGRKATEHLLDQLDIGPDDRLLDLGCGLGGASRLAAQRYGCRVTGIDLTPDFVEAGTTLCRWVGLDGLVRLEVGDASATPFDDAAFDKAYMLHVGMNIADKAGLAREIFRLIKPGGTVGLYDMMRTADGALAYPVPWASDARGSALATPDDYKSALRAAGFAVTAECNRRDFALDFFARVKAAAAKTQAPPALGIHLVMGDTAPVKIGNMIDGIAAGILAPIELIAQKPARG